MAAAKSYFQDRLVLLLLSVNAFLALLATLLILFRIGSGSRSGFIAAQCRDCSNPNAINGLTPGHVTDILAFIGFAFLVLGTHAALSWRSYPIRRSLAIAILLLGALLLVFCIIVSYALLRL